MNNREKILAAAVGALLLMVVSYYAFNIASSALSTRQNRIIALEREMNRKKRTARKGAAAALKMKAYQERSLPPRSELARSLYSEWLLKLIKDAGFEDGKVNTVSGRPRKDLYTLFTFTVNGRGDLKQLTKFLHDYYSADHLHRIQRLTVKPIKDSRNLNLSLSIEALMIPSTPQRDTLSSKKSSRLNSAGLENYTKAILGRNLFSPPNQSPRLASIFPPQAYKDKSFNLSVKAEDSDKSDRLSFELGQNAPQGASIRSSGDQSAEVTWTPDKLGEYQITIRVFDNGLPSKSDFQTVQIKVLQAPPAFDAAKYTYLTAILGINQEPMIWLHDRTTSTTHKLRQGQKFQIGGLQGVVRRIGEKQVEIESNGRVITIMRGENLNQAIQKATPAEGNISGNIKTPM